MVRKSFLSVLLVVMMVLAAGFASAADIDGLRSDNDLGGYNVFINPGNAGDALLYTYFNLRDGENFFTLVNTDPTNGVIARIRFREATESEEVLDFNICLSANDMFAATLSDDGTQGRITQLPSDTTLTAPDLPVGGQPFKHAGNGGNAGVTADETLEGYFEVLSLETLPMEPTAADCTAITQGVFGNASDVDNVLFGTHFMLVGNDVYSYMATAFADWANLPIWTPNGLGDEFPIWGSGADGIDGVNWAATKDSYKTDYMLEMDGGITGESANVVNFFTKHEDMSLFGDSTGCDPDTGVTIGITFFDQNENTITSPLQFSPSRTTNIELCHEVNVIEIGNDNLSSDILDSGVEISLSAGAFGIGWVNIDLFNGVGIHSTDSVLGLWQSNGLPASVLWLQNALDFSHANEVVYSTDITLNGIIALP